MMRHLVAVAVAATAAWSTACRHERAPEPPASAHPATVAAVQAPVSRSCALLPAGVDSSDRVWWTGIRFAPHDSTLAGLTVSAIDSTWVLASLLCASSMPSDTIDHVTDADFGVGGDFNGDGQHDSALVGVFQRKSGMTGSFLLILTAEGSAWRVAYVVVDTSDGGQYSSVSADHSGEGVTWWFCRECDFRAEIEWIDGHYQPRAASSGEQ